MTNLNRAEAVVPLELAGSILLYIALMGIMCLPERVNSGPIFSQVKPGNECLGIKKKSRIISEKHAIYWARQPNREQEVIKAESERDSFGKNTFKKLLVCLEGLARKKRRISEVNIQQRDY